MCHLIVIMKIQENNTFIATSENKAIDIKRENN